jgi:SAM-dependent methyltransferase
MQLDVTDFIKFYDTGLGAVARQGIAPRLRQAWPETRGLTVLGLGYATPYLEAFQGEAGRVLALMLAGQGVVQWPDVGVGQVALAHETEIPLPDESVDRVLLVHALEHTEHIREMLREVWRIMPSSGRLIVVVPNRRGIWARLERTPFGHGHPYSPPQISRLLREAMFSPIATKTSLFMPPMKSRVMLRSAKAMENMGRVGLGVGGVLVAEAAKQIYAITGTPAPVASRKRSVAAAQTLDRS